MLAAEKVGFALWRCGRHGAKGMYLQASVVTADGLPSEQCTQKKPCNKDLTVPETSKDAFTFPTHQ